MKILCPVCLSYYTRMITCENCNGTGEVDAPEEVTTTEETATEQVGTDTVTTEVVTKKRRPAVRFPEA